jgi:hypothetical protein
MIMSMIICNGYNSIFNTHIIYATVASAQGCRRLQPREEVQLSCCRPRAGNPRHANTCVIYVCIIITYILCVCVCARARARACVCILMIIIIT